MRSLRNFFITYGISLIAFGLIGFFIWNRLGLGEKVQNNPDSESSNISVSGIAGDESEDVAEKGGKFTAVLCCYEDNPISPDFGRADSIVLINIDKSTKKFTFCPVPSYLIVDLGTDALKNEVYLGDLYKTDTKLFQGKLEALTGVDLNYYLYISTSEFVDIINEMGGIDYNVPMDMYYINAEGEELVNLGSGQTRLTGEEALMLVRFRSYPGVSLSKDDGDQKRRETQCDFLMTVFKTFLRPENRDNIDEIVKNFIGLLRKEATNFTFTTFIQHKDLFMNYAEYQHDVVQYPVKKTTMKLLENGEYIAEHMPDVDTAVGKVFSDINN